MFLFTGIGDLNAATTLFSDGFETGDLSAWSATGTNWTTVNFAAGAHSGDYRGQIKGNTDGDSSLVSEVSTVGFEDIMFSFWYQVDGFEEVDTVMIEWTDDGAVWHELETFSDGDEAGEWTEWSMDLPAGADMNVDFAVRFRAHLDATTDTFKLDDVSISGEVHEPPVDNPEEKNECKKGTWQSYGFKNQGQCVRFIQTGKDSR